MRFSVTASTAASVCTKHSIVAKSGESMPAPFAWAHRRIAPPGSATSRLASLGQRSLVRIASENAGPPPSASSAAARAAPAATVSRSSGTPITPVEATPTPDGSTPSSPDTAAIMARATSRPCSSVATFALPLFTTTARSRSQVGLARQLDGRGHQGVAGEQRGGRGVLVVAGHDADVAAAATA